MLQSRISAGATEKLPEWQKPHAQTLAWTSDMEGHAQKLGKQNSGGTLQSFASLFGRSPNQKGTIGK